MVSREGVYCGEAISLRFADNIFFALLVVYESSLLFFFGLVVVGRGR